MARPTSTEAILAAAGAPTYRQMEALAGLQHWLNVEGIETEHMLAAYPEAANFKNNLAKGRVLGMPIIAGPLGILVKVEAAD